MVAMKKILFLITLFVTLPFIASCNKKNTEGNEDIDMTQLKYYDYLNDNNPTIIIKVKGFGTMELQLFENIAPITVANIKNYITNNSYNNSNFHRIIEDFMIQGGIVKNTENPITGEFNSNGIQNDLKHYRGVISMARTSIKNSATSQFFIVHKDSPWLDGEYAAFGGLVSGFDVLDKIASVKTDMMDAPSKNVVIESIELK